MGGVASCFAPEKNNRPDPGRKKSNQTACKFMEYGLVGLLLSARNFRPSRIPVCVKMGNSVCYRIFLFLYLPPANGVAKVMISVVCVCQSVFLFNGGESPPYRADPAPPCTCSI